MRALAFNPDEALPKSFDIDRVEILRGPQGTLFGAGSEGGTVRYLTTQPSLTQSTFYSRDEVSYTEGGAPSYEAGLAAGGPLVDGTLGARLTVWYRRDGGFVNLIDPVTLATEQANANYQQTMFDSTGSGVGGVGPGQGHAELLLPGSIPQQSGRLLASLFLTGQQSIRERGSDAALQPGSVLHTGDQGRGRSGFRPV